jgi:hypothetical protein
LQEVEEYADHETMARAHFTLTEALEHFNEGPVPENGDEERTRYYTLLQEFNLHFRLRDVIWNVLQHWLKHPAEGNVYAWIDWLKVMRIEKVPTTKQKSCLSQARQIRPWVYLGRGRTLTPEIPQGAGPRSQRAQAVQFHTIPQTRKRRKARNQQF